MGYQLSRAKADGLFQQWAKKYDIFAPVLMEGEVNSLDEIEWNRKSDYSFKEVLLAINETLFYFTEDQTTVPKGPEKDILIFLRSCDLHAVKRLDQIYLQNGVEDFYYARVRERAKFILMGCESTCASGFCVSMGTNQSDNYDAYVKVDQDTVYMDVKCSQLNAEVCAEGMTTEEIKVAEVTPDFVTENKEKVTLPKNLSNASFTDEIWQEYGARCIKCGRCVDVCPMMLKPLHYYKLVKAQDFQGCKDMNIMDCMECRCCEYICSSKLPLVTMIKMGKNGVRGLK